MMTKFTDFATLDKLCSVMGLVVRTGRAEAAPEIATNATKGDERKSTEPVHHIDDIGESECYSQLPWGGLPGGVDAAAAVEIDPLFRSPAGSLPPADVDSVVMHALSDSSCTVGIGGPSLEDRIAQERASRRKKISERRRQMAT